MLRSLVIAQETLQVSDNGWAEQYRVPFGEWIQQLVFWAVNNPVTEWLGSVLEWPFATFFELIMSEHVDRDSIVTIPWLWLVIAVFVVTSFSRNTRVGFACAVMLSACAFLGAEYWRETAKTIGMILVAVVLCTAVGVPLGILCGRIDAVWKVVRPTLDAMQVVHSFVYMLPFIFFFGIGEVSATMVTMVFALPPLVRLTNLGIRQVPEDVVEAARSYGAPEYRVLTDVQLPLARPAIMTGLNQTLLLSISMLGIAAIMGAGGLGRLLFRAINSLDLGLASSAGLAFFLVAVVLDRMSQTEAQDGVGLLTKFRLAWAHRRAPEEYMEALGGAPAGVPAQVEEPPERPAEVSGGELSGLLLAALGALGVLIALFLPWAKNASSIGAWGRYADENVDGALNGMTWNGIEASGGSFFGVIAGGLALLGLLAAVRPLLSFPGALPKFFVRAQSLCLVALAGIIVVIWVMNILGSSTGPLSNIGLVIFALCAVLLGLEAFTFGTPRMGADGALIAGLGGLGAAVGYVSLNPSLWTDNFELGIGAWVALAGSVLMCLGSLVALFAAPYVSRRPLSQGVSYGKVIAGVLAVLLVIFGGFAAGKPTEVTDDNGNVTEKVLGPFGWYYDGRTETSSRTLVGDDGELVDIDAEIERIQKEAEGKGGNDQVVAATEIQNLINSVQRDSLLTYTGFDVDGPRLAWPSLAFTLIGLVAAVGLAFLRDETQRWRLATMLAGLGVAVVAVPAGYILGVARVAEGRYPVSGIGAFLTVIAGFALFAAGRSVVGEFRRRKIYADLGSSSATEASASTIDISDEGELEAQLASDKGVNI